MALPRRGIFTKKRSEGFMKRIFLSISVAVALGSVLSAEEGLSTPPAQTSAKVSATPVAESTASPSSTEKTATDSGMTKASFSQADLDTALAPVALYPDSLLAQLLMAVTYPDQVMEAAEWSKKNDKLKGEDAVKAVQEKKWDSSVASLVAFPQVLEMLSSKPDWTKKLGEMFLADPDAVMDTIQKLRHKAKEAGNLKDTKEQKVIVKEASSSSSSGGNATVQGGNNTTIIEIQPADPQTVYVPVYNPTVVYGTWWHPTPPYFYSPPYYNPAAAIIGFGAAIAVGHCLWSHWNWHHHDIDIDIHRHNSININRKIDINSNRASWRKNIRERNPRYSGIGRRRDSINRRGQGLASDRMNRKAVSQERLKAVEAMKKRGVNLGDQRKELMRNRGEIEKRIDRADASRRFKERSPAGGVSKRENLRRDRAAGAIERRRDRVGTGASTADRRVRQDRKASVPRRNTKDIPHRNTTRTPRVSTPRVHRETPARNIRRSSPPRNIQPRNIQRSRPARNIQRSRPAVRRHAR